MHEIRVVLVGPPYPEPRYYGSIEWSPNHIYLRHPGGGKDSRHSDGRTRLTTPELDRSDEMRIPTSEVTRELVNFISLSRGAADPPVLRGLVRGTDIVLQTDSAGTVPRLAVEIVEQSHLPQVIGAWVSHTGVSSVQTFVDKGLGQSLLVVLASNVS